jgi:SAM-dependent methyltransferase
MDETTPHAGPQGPTPERIFQSLNAYQQTAALKAAVELDLFTAVAETDGSVEALAARCQAAPRGVRILCDFLTVLQFLSKRDGRYALAEDSALFLDRRSPAYVGGMVAFLTGPPMLGFFHNLTDSVRRGGAAEGEGSTAAEHPMWEDFARGMAAMVRPSAEAIAALTGVAGMGPCKVLDVAAGHGVFGVTLARQNPQAEVYAVDWKNVLPFARATAERAGVADRFHEIPGDAFAVEFGEGYDLVLLTNFFHHFDRETCVRLMRKVRAALKEGGRAVTLEFVPDEDRVSPPIPAAFALIMLSNTPGGDAYTFSEFEGMFREAGFGRSELHASPPQHIIITEK